MERALRRIDRLIGELERAVVMTERELGAASLKRPNRLRRIHVLVAHEPARLVGTDRKYGEAERAIAVARGAEMVAVAPTRIRHVVDAPGRCLDDERGPQRLVAIGEPARGPVPRRYQRDGDICPQFDVLVPVVGL